MLKYQEKPFEVNINNFRRTKKRAPGILPNAGSFQLKGNCNLPQYILEKPMIEFALSREVQL